MLTSVSMPRVHRVSKAVVIAFACAYTSQVTSKAASWRIEMLSEQALCDMVLFVGDCIHS
jgi:hypothetical protein